MKKLGNALLAVTMLVAAQGCYGPFELTRKVYNFNSTIGNKWANEGVFLVMVIIPVYQVSALVDGIVLNSVEFWTGKSALSSKRMQSIQDGDKQAVMSYAPDSRKMRIDLFAAGRPTGTVLVEPGADGSMTARREDGTVLKAATMADGSVVVTDAQGRTVRTFDRASAGK